MTQFKKTMRLAELVRMVSSEHHCHLEMELVNEPTMDVQVRLSRTGSTQLFIGVYSGTGMALHEEYFDRPGESMTRALAWGIDRARCLATEPQRIGQQVAPKHGLAVLYHH